MLSRVSTIQTLERVASHTSQFYHQLDHNDVPEHADEDTAPDLSWASIRHYAATRFTSLLELHTANIKDLNPLENLREMTLSNWNYFFMGFFAWMSASADFFCTAVAGTQIAESLNVTTAQITWGLSAVLMVRSSGAIVFGHWADTSSRKWPFITCVAMFCALQIGTGFAQTYRQFLAIRALSGICMGGTFGPGIATVLDDAPMKARSFLSGLYFAAYPLGFVFASVFWRAFEFTSHSWKTLFWFSSFLPGLLVVWRLACPETKYFRKVLQARELIKKDFPPPKLTFKQRLSSYGKMCQKYWLLFSYLVLLLAGSNYLTHGSQDLYPSMLRKQLKMSENAIVVIITVVNIGGAIGCLIVGLMMEVTGRRLALIICAIGCGAFIYPTYMIQTEKALIGGGIFLFAFASGVWGVIPIHLSELSPPDARALVAGLAYQLGNLASSASSTIETTISENYVLEYENGVAVVFDYAKTMSILTGAVCIYLLFVVFVGHEKFHRDLSSPLIKRYIEKLDKPVY